MLGSFYTEARLWEILEGNHCSFDPSDKKSSVDVLTPSTAAWQGGAFFGFQQDSSNKRRV